MRGLGLVWACDPAWWFVYTGRWTVHQRDQMTAPPFNPYTTLSLHHKPTLHQPHQPPPTPPVPSFTVKLYALLFLLVVVLSELEWTKLVRENAITHNWIVRGAFYVL